MDVGECLVRIMFVEQLNAVVTVGVDEVKIWRIGEVSEPLTQEVKALMNKNYRFVDHEDY